jgi:hypothetical protein
MQKSGVGNVGHSTGSTNVGSSRQFLKAPRETQKGRRISPLGSAIRLPGQFNSTPWTEVASSSLIFFFIPGVIQLSCRRKRERKGFVSAAGYENPVLPPWGGAHGAGPAITCCRAAVG